MTKEITEMMFEYNRKTIELKGRAKRIRKIRCRKNLEKWLKRHKN